MRMASRQVLSLLASRSHPIERFRRRFGPRMIETGHGSDAEDEKAERKRVTGGVRGLKTI